MNKYFFICLAFIVFTSCQNNPFAAKKDKAETETNDQNNNANNGSSNNAAVNADLETLGEYIFNAIKRKDYARFSKYILSRKDAKYLINVSTDPEKPSEEQILKDYEERLTDIEKAFNELTQDRELDRCNLAYRRTEYSITKEHNVEAADVTLIFSCDGEEAKIKITRNPKVNGRWYIMGLPQAVKF